MKLYIAPFFLIFVTSCGYTQDTAIKWESKFRKLSFQCNKPLTMLPTLDTKEKTLTGVIDNRDGKSFIIQITDDISQERLSDKKYFESVKQTMLRANEKNKIIEEDSTIFHGIMTHRQVFMMHTDKWGLLKQINYVGRNGVEFLSVQILFPSEENNKDTAVPSELLEFDKTINLKLK